MKHLPYLILFMAVTTTALGQTMHLNRTGGTVAVGSDGQPVDASAALDVKSTTQGVLLPRLTTAQRTAIATPANGLLVFDSDTQSFWFFQNGAWAELSGGGGGTTTQWSTPSIGPHVSFAHFGDKGHWLLRSAADSGNVILQDINRGRVGIGTAFPNSTLSLVGRQYTSASNTADFSNTAIGPNVSFIHYGSTGDWLIRSAASNGNVIIQDVPGGIVGIGTAFPNSTLSVQGRVTGSTSGNTAEFFHPSLGTNRSHIHQGPKGDWYIRSAANDGNVVIQDQNVAGNTGIGTASPTAKLNVSTTGENAVRIDGVNPYVLFRNVNDASREYGFIRTWTTNPFNPAAYYGLELGTPTSAAGQPVKHLMFSTNYNLRMVILDNGNVGIGINNPAQKLAVNGTIRARELIVETSSWPDYVFAPNYRLRPLAEVERFIETHHHLPGVAPAAEMEKNGVAVADVTTKMMQKIEELTLYMIRQEKQIQALQAMLQTGSNTKKRK